MLQLRLTSMIGLFDKLECDSTLDPNQVSLLSNGIIYEISLITLHNLTSGMIFRDYLVILLIKA